MKGYNFSIFNHVKLTVSLLGKIFSKYNYQATMLRAHENIDYSEKIPFLVIQNYTIGTS